MKQIARQIKGTVVTFMVGVAAVTVAAALGPMAGPARSPQSGRSVSPESCMTCEKRPADWKACHETALSLAMERDWSRAIAIEEGVHRVQPRNAEVSAVLARLYQDGTRNTVRAFELYHEALGLSPGYPPALLGLGNMMEDAGSLDVAARYFRRGMREKPDEPQFKIRLAEVLVKDGRGDEARPILAEIVDRWPQSKEAESAKRIMPPTALARP